MLPLAAVDVPLWVVAAIADVLLLVYSYGGDALDRRRRRRDRERLRRRRRYYQ